MNLFANTLSELNKGALSAELSDKLTEAVAAVKEHGGKARLRFDLIIKKISDEGVEITPDIDLSKPTKAQRSSVYFANDNGELSKNPFTQPELPLTIVAKPEEATEPTAEAKSKI